jgi:predicted nucleic acid-binding protein
VIHYIALLDANVLYSAPIRDLFLQLAVSDVFRARWTEDIHREWIDALVRNVPHLNRTALEHTRHLMDRAARDCLVTGYEKLIPAIDLPDPNDRHVLAAAIVARCDVIVTGNLQHFPHAAVGPYGVEVQHPDEFLSGHLNLVPTVFCEATRRVRNRLKSPPFTVQEYLINLSRQGLVATASELERFTGSI